MTNKQSKTNEIVAFVDSCSRIISDAQGSILQHLLVELYKDQNEARILRISATDEHRLGVFEKEYAVISPDAVENKQLLEYKEDFKCLVDYKNFRKALSLFRNCEEIYFRLTTDDRLVIHSPTNFVESLAINANEYIPTKFPPIELLSHSEPKIHALVNTQYLIDICNAAKKINNKMLIGVREDEKEPIEITTRGDNYSSTFYGLVMPMALFGDEFATKPKITKRGKK